MRRLAVFALILVFAVPMPKPDPVKTKITLKRVPSGLQVVVIPRDRLGNLIGPGYASHFTVVTSVGKVGPIADGTNGFYSFPIQGVPAADPVVTVSFDGVPLGKSELVPQPKKHK